ncbi:thiopeptide-type bacteriocin biosynthesis protein [Herbidospora mongoliensis]|uniref:thiopeptide-type bacteriocin biosynthesis protein n=1 Tax=Herbidospora mongoliensis TaxID=688067 RepID=UPI00082BE347|nr:thiopeptide-type bacteriocin biosynthesis protein [Herbidospora mongoliensis]
MTDRWISLHAFHRTGTDLLLVTAVDGLIKELDGRLDRYFFLRYWEGGPHLRLRLLPRVPDDAATIGRRATAVLEEYLAAYPATTPWDREGYALLAAEFARQEGLAAYDERLRPDDHVEAIAYRPEYAMYGGPEAVDAVERHFTDSSRIALAILRGEPDPRRRLGHALTAMMLTLMAWEPDPGRLASVLAGERDRWDPAPARARHAEIFAGRRDALTAQAERCRRIATSGSTWWRSVDALQRRLADLQLDSRIVLERCVHLFCNRLGLSIAEEAHLRYLTAATLEKAS